VVEFDADRCDVVVRGRDDSFDVRRRVDARDVTVVDTEKFAGETQHFLGRRPERRLVARPALVQGLAVVVGHRPSRLTVRHRVTTILWDRPA